MNVVSKKLIFVLIGATVIFTGCKKKPVRPEPSATVMNDGAIDPNALGNFDTALTEAGSGLLPQGVIETEDKIIGLFQPVYFAFDQSAIAAAERPKLQEAKAYLDAHPTQRLLLEGRCDWRGTPEYNLGLGDRRAASSRQYLETLGVPADRLETVSKGDLEATENGGDDVMAKDRRVDLIVLKK